MTQNPFFADPRLIEALLGRSREISCGEGRVLFNQGDSPDGLYLVQSGEAALAMTSPTGQLATCFQCGPGSVLGLPAVVADQPYSLTAMADKGSEIRFVARSDFEELMRADLSLYPCVLQILAAEVRAARSAAIDWKSQAGRDQFRTATPRTPTASSN